MKNIRIKALGVLLVILTTLTIWSWVTNSYNLDITTTKNAYYQNTLRVKLNQSNDPEFLRRQGLEFLEMMNKRSEDRNRIAGHVQKLLTWTTLLAVLSLIILATEIMVRRKNDRQHGNYKTWGVV